MGNNAFISFVSADREWAERLGAALVQHGWRAELERSRLHEQESERARIFRDLEAADVFLLVCSAASVGAEEIERHLALANRYETPIVVAQIDGTAKPASLAARPDAALVSFADGSFEERLERLIATAERAAARSQRAGTQELETLLPDFTDDGAMSPAQVGPSPVEQNGKSWWGLPLFLLVGVVAAVVAGAIAFLR